MNSKLDWLNHRPVSSVVRERGEMTLSRFKFIWYMEWGHRQWGRLIGVAYAIPAAFFWYRGYFNKGMKVRVGCYGALIGFQVSYKTSI